MTRKLVIRIADLSQIGNRIRDACNLFVSRHVRISGDNVTHQVSYLGRE